MSMGKNYVKVESMRNIISNSNNGSDRKVSYRSISHRKSKKEIITGTEEKSTNEQNPQKNLNNTKEGGFRSVCEKK